MMYYAAIWYDFDIIITDYTQLYPAMKPLQPTVLIAPPIFYQLLHTRFSAPGSQGLAPDGWAGRCCLCRWAGAAPDDRASWSSRMSTRFSAGRCGC